jgi:16S rRNA (guanine1207-N2)-methyltransferase
MSEHYFTEKPASEIKERSFRQVIKNTGLYLTSVSGVFAFGNKVDRASRLLIEVFSPSGKTVLDLGCGYGAIGLFIKALYPEQAVYLSDINERAVELRHDECAEKPSRVRTVKSDLFSSLDAMTFDDIVTNPPIASGKKLLTNLIRQAYDRLNPDGALWLVAYHNKGGSTLRTIMENCFSNVSDVAKSGGIRVYRSVKRQGVPC